MADTIGDNLNVIQTAIGHLAAEGLTKVGKGGYGCVISPATWAYNYKTQGSTPTSVDVGFWGVSLAGGIFGPVALAGSYLKALVDDDVTRKVAAVRASEPARCRPGILALVGWGPPSSLAGDFAATGGVAWQHPNGLWVSVVDGQKRLVPDYQPLKFQAIIRPVLPLKKAPGSKGFMTTDKWRL
jgi:hypothetical protein